MYLPASSRSNSLARLSQERIRREIRHSAQLVQSNMFVLKLGPLGKNDNRIRPIGPRQARSTRDLAVHSARGLFHDNTSAPNASIWRTRSTKLPRRSTRRRDGPSRRTDDRRPVHVRLVSSTTVCPAHARCAASG